MRDEIYKRIIEVGNDAPEIFGAKDSFFGGYLLQQNPDEYADLICYLKGYWPLFTFCEVGAGSGGNFRFIMENVGFRTGISMDDGQHPYADKQKENFANIQQPFHIFRGNSHSHEAAQFLYNMSNLRCPYINCAFIDGDHSYSGVKQDFFLLMPYLLSNALVIFHDIVAVPELRQAMDDIIAIGLLTPDKEFIGPGSNIGIAVCRKV